MAATGMEPGEYWVSDPLLRFVRPSERRRFWLRYCVIGDDILSILSIKPIPGSAAADPGEAAPPYGLYRPADREAALAAICEYTDVIGSIGYILKGRLPPGPVGLSLSDLMCGLCGLTVPEGIGPGTGFTYGPVKPDSDKRSESLSEKDEFGLASKDRSGSEDMLSVGLGGLLSLEYLADRSSAIMQPVVMEIHVTGDCRYCK